VYGNGSNIRDWLYVEDHCCAIDKIIRQGSIGETYNIGGNNELSNLQVIYTICEILEELRPTDYSYAELITFVKDRAGHDWRYAVNTEKIEKELAWRPIESFSSGIRKILINYINP
jgi:dTDP-glucose 4,6-dehydratase